MDSGNGIKEYLMGAMTNLGTDTTGNQLLLGDKPATLIPLSKKHIVINKRLQ